mmetsp:Transcript_87424/g.182952  ORF Transcript_87424/g.182952 Transcript_87424/m.182952 type:complete len:214 (-) Transcript_87424:2046-2687(-)
MKHHSSSSSSWLWRSGSDPKERSTRSLSRPKTPMLHSLVQAVLLIIDALLDGVVDTGGRRNVKFLPCIREVSIVTADPLDWRLQVQEASFCDLRGDLCTEAVRGGSLVGHHQSSRLLDRLLDGVDIPRDDGLKIDDLARDAIFRSSIRCGLHSGDLRAPGQERNVLAFPHNFRLADWKFVASDRNIAIAVLEDCSVENLGFEEEHRVGLLDRC